MHVLYVLALVLCLGLSIEVLPHFGGGAGARDTHPAHNTVLVTLERLPLPHVVPLKSARQQDFQTIVRDALKIDQCELSFTGLSDDGSELTLTLYCHHLNNTRFSGAREDRAPLPRLSETLHVLGKHYKYKARRIEYLASSRHATVGRRYRSYDSLDDAMKIYFSNLGRESAIRAEQLYRAKFVQSSAPWGPDRVDQHYGARDQQYHYNQLGSQVDLYIVDTGILTTHQEFGGRAVFLSNTVGDGINTDCAGHGTLCASLSGGATYGVAKGVNLWAVKVLDCSGDGDSFTIVTGVMAINEHVAQRRQLGYRAVASFSLGGDASSAIDDAIRSLIANNITVAVAAGNEYGNACDYSPSRLGGSTLVMTVGASNSADARPSFSNQGNCLTMYAPGVRITGADNTNNGALQTADGTSMATPFVAGVAALVLDQNLLLTVSQTVNMMKAWSTPDVITGVSSGTRNLLYSLIVWDAVPNISPSPPSTPTLPSIPGQDSASPPRASLYLWLTLLPLLLLLLLFQQ